MKLEVSHPLAATWNNGVVTGADAIGDVTDYYGVLQKIIEYMFVGAKELRVMFLYCDWFDGTRVDDFGIVEVKHKSHLSGNNIVLVQ
jgi:hypothetical protein